MEAYNELSQCSINMNIVSRLSCAFSMVHAVGLPSEITNKYCKCLKMIQEKNRNSILLLNGAPEKYLPTNDVRVPLRLAHLGEQSASILCRLGNPLAKRWQICFTV